MDAPNNEDCVDRLLGAMSRYDPSGFYDEVFTEVSDRIGERGEAGKADICVLITWKRAVQGRWITDFLLTPDAEVRDRTRKAFAAATDQQRLDALAPLPGFSAKYAMATVVLIAYAPVEFGGLDRRALHGLKVLGCPVTAGRGVTLRYLERVRELRDAAAARRPGVTARNIDQALWVLGAEAS